MAIRIVTDSASDILPGEAKDLGLTVIPMIVNFDGVGYADGIELSHKEFYEKLIENDMLPTTSQISPGKFGEVFEEFVSAGDTIVAVVVSSVLSGTYQSACIAAEPYPGKVFVVDSLNACIGERLLALRGLELQRNGMDAAAIAAQLEQERGSIRILAALNTLEYLKKGGRISAATAFAGELLGIKPVVTVREGAVEMLGKARGSKNVNNLIRKSITEGNGVDFSRPYCLAYSGLSDAMLHKYIEDNEDLWRADVHDLPIRTVGSVIGTHVGPGAIALAYFEKDN